MEQQTEKGFISGQSRETARKILQRIQETSAAFRIVSL
jgi:hypothetical protein